MFSKTIHNSNNKAYRLAVINIATVGLLVFIPKMVISEQKTPVYAPCFLVSAPSLLVSAPSFLVSAPSFLVCAPSFLGSAPSFLVSKTRISGSEKQLTVTIFYVGNNQMSALKRKRVTIVSFFKTGGILRRDTIYYSISFENEIVKPKYNLPLPDV